MQTADRPRRPLAAHALTALFFVLSGILFGMAVRAGVELWSTGADPFTVAKPWLYSGGMFLFLSFAVLTQGLSTKDQRERTKALESGFKFLAVSLLHFVLLYVGHVLDPNLFN